MFYVKSKCSRRERPVAGTSGGVGRYLAMSGSEQGSAQQLTVVNLNSVCRLTRVRELPNIGP